MSLPMAPKDIATHPIKGSVVDPIDKNMKEADVDRKVRLTCYRRPIYSDLTFASLSSACTAS